LSKATIEKLAAAQLEIRDRCRNDKMYLSQQLGYDFQQDVHPDLFANYITYDSTKPWVDQSPIKNRLVLWSRGFYKTTSIIVEIVQLILNFPDSRILLMQGTVPNTKTLLAEIKTHFDGTNFRSNLKDIFPEFCSLDRRLGSAMEFTIPNRTRTLKDPTVRVASPKTTKAGQHYDAGFFDDLVNEVNYRSPAMIKKTIDDFTMYIPLIDPGGYKFVTGTRYSFGDLYEQILRWNTNSKEWSITVKPCWRLVDDVLVSNFPTRQLADSRVVGISIEQLKAIQVQDPEMFASQYLNLPISVSAHLFPEELMLAHVVTPKDPSFPELGYKTLFVDLSGGRDKARNSDDTVIICSQQDSMNKIYCVDGIGGQWGPLAQAQSIINMALKHRPIRIWIEESAAGFYFVEYLKTVARDVGVNLPLDFIKVNNHKDAKHMRISVISGFLKQNKLYFCAGLPCWEKMLEQFVAYPRMKHDDYPDTVALMCEHYQAWNPIPKVKSLASFIVGPETTPLAQFILDREHESLKDGGSMGSDFE
jgi:predicted phage terminase large subunit-like protein